MKKINWKDLDETMALWLLFIGLILCAAGLVWVFYSYYTKHTIFEAAQLIVFVTCGVGLYYIFEVGCNKIQKRTGKELKCSKNAIGAFSLFVFVAAMLVLVLR